MAHLDSTGESASVHICHLILAHACVVKGRLSEADLVAWLWLRGQLSAGFPGLGERLAMRRPELEMGVFDDLLRLNPKAMELAIGAARDRLARDFPEQADGLLALLTSFSARVSGEAPGVREIA